MAGYGNPHSGKSMYTGMPPKRMKNVPKNHGRRSKQAKAAAKMHKGPYRRR